MNATTLEKQFKKIGAAVVVNPNGNPTTTGTFSVDFRNNNFEIFIGDEVEVAVVDVDKGDKHLLLNFSEPGNRKGSPRVSHKILCGHDERDYFVAAVPERYSAKNVVEAKQALKPAAVHQVETGVKNSKKNKRKLKNKRIRQGEWFFVKADGINPAATLIYKKEPLSRGMGSKPHIVDEIYRTGGESVRVCSKYPTGITESEYNKLVKKDPELSKLNWRFMTRNAGVYARGKVKHPDHATITLDGWHLVVMNTENESTSRRGVAFLD